MIENGEAESVDELDGFLVERISAHPQGSSGCSSLKKNATRILVLQSQKQF
jgi:hypothetical protein